MNEIKNHINQVIIEINEIAEYLYQQNINQGYAKLNKTLGNIMNVLDEIFLHAKENNINLDEQTLLNKLTLAMNTMEDKDTVLLADILVYEIVEQLEIYKEQI